MFGLVSIIMPSFNTGKFIAETIESVLNQTYKNWELLIVDDCSTDDTAAIVKNFDDARIKFFRNEKNSGAAFSRNFALQKARGEWIAFLDSDDLWLPEKLERQLTFMTTNNYKFCGTSNNLIDENSNDMGVNVRAKIRRVGKLGMYFYCWPNCLTVIYHAPTVGLIQVADLKKNNDYAMWLKIINYADFFALDEILAKYRVRENSLFHDSKTKLIKSFYTLWREGEKFSVPTSIFLTGVNLFFGVVKKIYFRETR